MSRWQCKECKWIGMESDLLTAPSPFDAGRTLSACPICKQCDEGFDNLCDEPGCNANASCGWPTRDKQAYRRTCAKHMQT